jgi:hypothetical protein
MNLSQSSATEASAEGGESGRAKAPYYRCGTLEFTGQRDRRIAATEAKAALEPGAMPPYSTHLSPMTQLPRIYRLVAEFLDYCAKSSQSAKFNGR